jgi:hypothetical protein
MPLSNAVPPPQHRGLYKYWSAARGAGSIPTRADIDPLDIIQLLPFVGLIERRDDAYYWRLMGTALVDHFGDDFTGKQYGTHVLPASFAAATAATFDAALERQTPFFDECMYWSPKGYPQTVSRLVCPLGASGPHLPMVIQTRIHRACSGTFQFGGIPDQAWGKLINRSRIFSVDDVDRLTEEWWTNGCSLVVAN